MTQFGDMGEKLYRCKVCGYVAKSGAGLTGHIQLAHGARAAGKAELAKIGEEVAAVRQVLSENLPNLLQQDGLNRVADELGRLNDNLQSLREDRPMPIYIRSKPDPSQFQLPSPFPPPLPPPPLPPPNNVVDGLGALLGGAIILGLGLSILDAMLGNEQN